MFLSCTVSGMIKSNNGVPLKSELGVIQGHSIWHHSIDPIGLRVPTGVPQ